MELRVPHALSAPELARRLLAAAQTHDIDVKPAADGRSGVIAKDAGFLGKVRASYAIEPDALVVQVSEAPAFLSEASLRRMLEDELGKLVAR